LGFRHDVDRLLQGADLFLFGSFSEGIAGALLQAMATGRLVVSTAAGGIPEYLVDGENGFLVDVGDHESMARKIREALSLTPERREKIADNATVNKYVSLFKELSRERLP